MLVDEPLRTQVVPIICTPTICFFTPAFWWPEIKSFLRKTLLNQVKVILLKSPIGIFVLFCLILKPPEQNPNKFQPTSKQSHITSPPKKRSNKKNFPKSYRKKGVLFFLFPNFGVHNFPLDQTKTSTPNCCPTGSAIPETSPGATATADSSYGDGLDVSLATTGLGTSCD